KCRSEIGAAAKPGMAGSQVAQIHVNGRHVGVAHVRDQGNATRDESALGLLGSSDLTPCLLREHAPDVAHVHTDFLENVSAHEPRFAPALQAVPRRLAPTAWLEAAHGLERFECRAD